MEHPAREASSSDTGGVSDSAAPRSRSLRLLAAALGVVGVVLVVWALTRGGSTSAAEPAAAPRTPAPSTPAPSTPAPHRKPASAPTRPDPDAGVPTRLVVRRLGVDAPVIGIDAPGGTLTPPSDPQELGWWRAGAVPGAKRGGALITGHTVHTGGGALDDLEQLRRGDPITVRTQHGDVDYTVHKVTIFRKATLAEDAARLFDQERPGRLVLITCEDWDGTKYLSNVVVIGRPA